MAERFFDKKLMRFLMRRLLDGAIAGQAALLGLLWTDVGSVRSLIYNSDIGALALTMLSGAFAITFGSASMAIAVHRMAARREEPETRPD